MRRSTARRTARRATALRTTRRRTALRATFRRTAFRATLRRTALRTARRRTALRATLRRTALRATLRRTALRTALLALRRRRAITNSPLHRPRPSQRSSRGDSSGLETSLSAYRQPARSASPRSAETPWSQSTSGNAGGRVRRSSCFVRRCGCDCKSKRMCACARDTNSAHPCTRDTARETHSCARAHLRAPCARHGSSGARAHAARRDELARIARPVSL